MKDKEKGRLRKLIRAKVRVRKRGIPLRVSYIKPTREGKGSKTMPPVISPHP